MHKLLSQALRQRERMEHLFPDKASKQPCTLKPIVRFNTYALALKRGLLLLILSLWGGGYQAKAAHLAAPTRSQQNALETLTPQKRLPASFSLYWDCKLSPLVGACLLNDAWELYSVLWPFQNYLGVRAVHLWADCVASIFSYVPNHEIFGHGFRMREIGGLKPKYSMFYAVPTDNARLTHLKETLPPKEYLQKEIVVWLGGIEASQVLTKQVTLHCLREQRITLAQAWLFLQGTIDGIGYTNSAASPGPTLDDLGLLARAINHPDQSSSSLYSADGLPLNLRTLHAKGYIHDVRNYVTKINALYDAKALKALDVQQVKSAYMLNYLDPFGVYSLYYLAFEYLIKGNLHWKYPMIPIGEVGYLPGLKCIMTPYGLEKQLVNYLRYRHMSAQVFINYGQHYAHKSYGIGGQCNAIPVNDYLSLGGRLYVWKQPQLFTAAPADAPSKLGIMATVIGEYAFNQYFGFISHAGYKTQGYLQGECLASGFSFGLGMRLRI